MIDIHIHMLSFDLPIFTRHRTIWHIFVTEPPPISKGLGTKERNKRHARSPVYDAAVAFRFAAAAVAGNNRTTTASAASGVRCPRPSAVSDVRCPRSSRSPTRNHSSRPVPRRRTATATRAAAVALACRRSRRRPRNIRRRIRNPSRRSSRRHRFRPRNTRTHRRRSRSSASTYPSAGWALQPEIQQRARRKIINGKWEDSRFSSTPIVDTIYRPSKILFYKVQLPK